jgi:DNA invertase Pin-like site-specific DNA recombinase
MNTAVYIRKSREDGDKQGHRLTVQREQLPAYAQAQGWAVTIYDDGHASAARGKVEQLPERARLEADVRAGRVDIILVIELSRLSRDDTMQDYVGWLTMCADHKTKLATLSRILDPSQNSDWMLLLMEGGFSSVEMKVLSQRMKEGRDQAFAAGKFLGGIPPKPYLYDKALARPVVDAEQLAAMEILWTMAESMSAKAIAERLELPEIAVRRAISDDRLNFYQALRIDPGTGEAITCDWLPVMNAARAERIREKRRSRRTNGIRRDSAGLLSALGIMYCGYCGRTAKSWWNSKTRTDGSRLDYYACVTKNKAGACPKSRMISHQVINDKVVGNLLSTLASADQLRGYWQAYETARQNKGQGTDLMADLLQEEQKKSNLIKAIATGVLDFGDAKIEMEWIKRRISDIQNQISAENTTKEPDWETIILTRAEWEVLDESNQRAVISAVISRVTLFSSYAVINYMFPRTKSGSTEARINLIRGTVPLKKLIGEHDNIS